LNHFDKARIHDLGDDGQAKFVAGFAEELEAGLAHALKGVGTRARLERAAAEDIGAGGFDGRTDRIHPFWFFDGTGTGNHAQVAAADLHASYIDDAGLRMGFATGELIGWE